MSGSKRIAFVLGGMTFGGAERVISILANHYAGMGWQVDILTLLKPGCDFALHPSVRLQHLGGDSASRAKRAPAWLLGLRRYLRQERPQTVLSFAARINCLVLLSILGLGKRERPRVVISERNDPTRDTRTAPIRAMVRMLYPRADRIVFQTERAMSYFPKRLTASKGTIIRNPVGSMPERSAEPLPRVVAVGKLMPQKDHRLLLEAFAAIAGDFPELTLHIYGDGPLRAELEDKIRALGLTGRAVLEGWKSDIADELRTAELFVLSSAYEGLSNALMEALRMGLPCISTDCAGAEELIQDGENGRIVPIGDVSALAAAMRDLLRDPAAARRMGDAARQRSETFASETVLSQWEEVLAPRG